MYENWLISPSNFDFSPRKWYFWNVPILIVKTVKCENHYVLFLIYQNDCQGYGIKGSCCSTFLVAFYQVLDKLHIVALRLPTNAQTIVTNLLLTTVSVIVSILGNSLHSVNSFICGPSKTLMFLSQTFREELFEGCTLSKYSRDKLLVYWSNKPFRVSNNGFHFTLFLPTLYSVHCVQSCLW